MVTSMLDGTFVKVHKWYRLRGCSVGYLSHDTEQEEYGSRSTWPLTHLIHTADATRLSSCVASAVCT